jgi:phosphatidylglycerol---prolipoprotein diacylglyceryl transferase
LRPILFHLGPLPVYAYGFFLALSFLVGVQIALRVGRREGFSDVLILNTCTGIILSALFGSKFLYVLVNWSSVMASWEEFTSALRRGFVFYGGFLAALGFGFWYLRGRVENFWQYFDVLILPVPLGLFFTRIGCFLSGCCYGRPCELPWAVTFPPDSFAAYTFGPVHRIHPTQVYSSLLGLLCFGILLYIYKRRRFHGQVTLVFMVVYGLYRPVIEALRGDNMRGGLGIFTTSQLISAGTVLLAVLLYVRQSKMSRIPAQGDDNHDSATPPLSRV